MPAALLLFACNKVRFSLDKAHVEALNKSLYCPHEDILDGKSSWIKVFMMIPEFRILRLL